MKALAYRGPGLLELEERRRPHARKGEVLLHVDACSICGTDLRIAAGAHRAYANASGRIPGHEIAGTVVEVGAGVSAALGNRVFVAPNYGCAHCRACRRGQVNLCENLRAVGITEDGAFAEYLLLHGELVAQGNVLVVVGTADPGVVALAEPLACALRGSRACHITEGDVVLVYGAGPMGLLHVTLAKLAGASAVVVCEPNPERRRRAVEWGAASAHDADHDELRAALEDSGARSGADVVIVAAPVPDAQRQALELTAACGRVNLFAGLPRGGPGVELDTNLIHYKELVVTGTTASTNESCREALELILGGRVDIAPLIDVRLDLTSAQEAFELAGSGRVLKVVIEP
ncbi:MAG: alcohol dehydrogenase catalytic domain-containing protein [Acidimicrobiales bacterium]